MLVSYDYNVLLLSRGDSLCVTSNVPPAVGLGSPCAFILGVLHTTSISHPHEHKGIGLCLHISSDIPGQEERTAGYIMELGDKQ